MRRRQFIGLKRRQAMAGYVFLAPIIIGLVWLFLPALLQAWQYSVSDIRMTAEGIERLDNPDMPEAFRGMPANLVYLGLVALALLGFTSDFRLI